MKPLWFAYCTCEDYPVVQREIELREHGACVLRVDDLELLERIAGALDAKVAGTMVLARGLGIEAHAALVERIARTDGTGRVVALVEAIDPARIAPLFYAGADEVVPLEEARRAGAVEAVAEQQDEDGEGAAADKRAVGGEEAVAVPMEAQRTQAEAARGAAKGVSRSDSADDLDEPDDQPPPRVEAPWERDLPKHRAPVVCVASGRGGVGKTTIATAMACDAARMGLRAALVDRDLMFGDAYGMLGVEEPRDLEGIVRSASSGSLSETDIVRASMRVAPGLTVWGPIGTPERAELLGKPIELLLEVLRAEADVVVVDTSATWTDAVAAAVSQCDRCLMVADGATGAAPALQRAISLAGRFGLPRTRMTCVVNRVGARSCPEDTAMRIEMAAALSSKARVMDGGGDLAALAEIGHMDEAARAQTPFAQSVQGLTVRVLRELGCTLPEEALRAEARSVEAGRKRLRLPWKNVGEAA